MSTSNTSQLQFVASNKSANNTTNYASAASWGPTATDNINYIYCGVPVVLVNLFVLVVLIRGKGLLQKSVLLIGVVISNLYLGVHMVSFGAYRYANAAGLGYPLTGPWICIAMVFPLLLTMALNTGAIFLMLSSIERLLAIATPHWYRVNWSKQFEFGRCIRFRFSWMLFVVGHLLSLALLIIGLTFPTERFPYSWSCDLMGLFGITYIIFINAYNGLGGAISTILTLCTLAVGLRRFRKLPTSNGEAGRIRIQIQLAKSTATISILDFTLVALPNLLTTIMPFFDPMRQTWPSFIRPQNSTYTIALNSILIILALLVFNPRFRQATIEILRAQKAVEAIEKMSKKAKSWCRKQLGLKESAVAPQPAEDKATRMPVTSIPQVESRY